MQSFKNHLVESSLARIYQKTEKFDVGGITAFRDDKTRAQNRADNKKVLAYLMSKGYSITKVKGSYIENFGTDTAKEVGEESFFVVDHNKTGKLKDDLIKLGRMYDQDSILFVKQGQSGVLIGTSKRDNAFPPFNKTEVVGKPVFGKAEGKFFSRVKGRQFAFESVELVETISLPVTNNGRWAMEKMAQNLQEEMQHLYG